MLGFEEGVTFQVLSVYELEDGVKEKDGSLEK